MGAEEPKRRARMAGGLSGCLSVFVLCLCPPSAAAEEVRVAVATNFAATLGEIVTNFERDTGHAVVVSSGSSGAIYAQIRHGAPFDVFFSADAMRPKRLEEEGFAVCGSRRTYAVGRLTLWSATPGAVKEDGRSTLSGHFEHLAMANPGTAPYGAASKQTLQALGLWNHVRDRIVQGENIGQTFQFVVSHNARLGFVALSQALHSSVRGTGSRWDVPAHLHAPLRQQAVLLVNGRHNAAATALLDYVQEEQSRTIIERVGYGIE